MRLFHTQGELAAITYLNSTFDKPTWKTGGNRTKATIANGSVRTYIDFCDGDSRTAALGDTRSSISLDGYDVAAPCDVILLQGDGRYVGRLCQWGVEPRPLSDNELAVVACPAILALGRELGEPLIEGVEVWQLRSETRRFVSADDALGHLDDLRRLLARLQT